MAQETTTAAAVTYLQLISQDEKAQKKESLSIKAQEGAISVQKDIMELRAGIANVSTRIEAAKRQIPYSVKAEYKLTQEKNELESALEFATAILNERFSDSRI